MSFTKITPVEGENLFLLINLRKSFCKILLKKFYQELLIPNFPIAHELDNYEVYFFYELVLYA
jgi:hypothetical protein